MSTLRSRIEAAAVRFADEIVSAIEIHSGGTEWVDQHESPLGKRRHLEAVRRGDLKGRKEGRRVLVRRAEVDAYLERNAVATKTDTEDADDVLREMGLRSVRRSA